MSKVLEVKDKLTEIMNSLFDSDVLYHASCALTTTLAVDTHGDSDREVLIRILATMFLSLSYTRQRVFQQLIDNGADPCKFIVLSDYALDAIEREFENKSMEDC